MNSVDGNKDAQGNPLVYAGGLKMNRKMVWKDVEQSIRVSAASIPSKTGRGSAEASRGSGISRGRGELRKSTTKFAR